MYFLMRAPCLALMFAVVAMPAWGQQVSASDNQVARQHGVNGLEFLRKGLLSEAEAELIRALALDPADAVASTNLGIVLSQTGRDREALARYSAAILAKQRYALGYMLRGLAHWRLGEMTSALRDFNLAVAIEPSNPRGLGARAIVQGELKQYESAVADASVAIALGLQDPMVFAVRGQALMDLGRVEEGRRDLAAADQLDPGARVELSTRINRPHIQENPAPGF